MFRVSRVLWLFLLVSSSAQAQEAVVAPPAPAGPVGPAPAAPAPVAPTAAPVQVPGAALPPEAPLPGRSTVGGDEMLRQGSEYRQQIQAIVFQIQGQAEQAKRDKDVIRLNCLLDKLTQVKVNGTMLDQSLQELQQAVVRHDEGTALHEYTRVTIINQKAQVLRTEADACVGSETNYVGPTKVYVETPPGISDNPDQPAPVAPIDPGTTRPPVASPYQ
jgi:hypothetical protein